MDFVGGMPDRLMIDQTNYNGSRIKSKVLFISSTLANLRQKQSR